MEVGMEARGGGNRETEIKRGKGDKGRTKKTKDKDNRQQATDTNRTKDKQNKNTLEERRASERVSSRLNGPLLPGQGYKRRSLCPSTAKWQQEATLQHLLVGSVPPPRRSRLLFIFGRLGFFGFCYSLVTGPKAIAPDSRPYCFVVFLSAAATLLCFAARPLPICLLSSFIEFFLFILR